MLAYHDLRARHDAEPAGHRGAAPFDRRGDTSITCCRPP
jgi:hypothetical protein